MFHGYKFDFLAGANRIIKNTKTKPQSLSQYQKHRCPKYPYNNQAKKIAHILQAHTNASQLFSENKNIPYDPDKSYIMQNVLSFEWIFKFFL